MTKQDYELIATEVWRSGYVVDRNKVRQEARENMRRLVATNLASQFEHDDPHFDRDSFMKACGFTS